MRNEEKKMGERLSICLGDIISAQVEVVVNAWNRNFIPYWLLIPQGVAGALRKKAGKEPFREVRKAGLLELGEVVVTGAGKLIDIEKIFHIAALHATWRSSPKAVRLGAKNLFIKTAEHNIESLAIPLLGAGTGGVDPEESLRIIREEWSAARERPKQTEIYIFDESLFERLVWRGPWQKGLKELESQQYWEVHESWEEIWALLPDSATREFVQAGIQFAAACYKPEQVLAGRDAKGMQRGMTALIGSARKHLLAGEGQVSVIRGLDSDVLGRALNQLEETLEDWKDGRELSLIRQRIYSVARETAATLQ